MIRISTAYVCLLLVASVGNAQQPDSLRDSDLVVASLPHASDTATTRRMLGAPRQIQASKRNDDGVQLITWDYAGLAISFDSTGRRYRADITSSAHRMRRGVRIGDPISKVRQAYGVPNYADSSHLLYVRSNDESETRGITFLFSAGKLTRIIVGEVISVE